MNAAASTVEFSSSSLHRSSQTRIPRTQRSSNNRTAWSRISSDSSSDSAISGTKAFSSSCPPAAASVTAASLAITRIATSPVISAITGLTLPGMIEDPACTAGSLSSPSPPAGPLASRRRSPEIFSRFTEAAFSRPETSTNTSIF
ncbi:hypothetical protein D3C75_952670 [compost metagenome]